MKRSFDLAKENRFYYFYFKDDELYSNIPEESRNFDPYVIRKSFDQNGWCLPSCRTDDVASIRNSSDFVPLLLSWLWRAHHQPIILDIGSHVGRFAIGTAHYVRFMGRSARIIAVEAGPTAELIPHTIELNGLGDLVSLLPVAISDQDGPVAFAFSPEQTNAAAIQAYSYHSEARLVSGISSKTLIDTYTDSQSFLVKLDVEGIEPSIIYQLDSAFPRKIFIFIAEFTPWKLGGIDEAVSFLHRLEQQYRIVSVKSFLYDHALAAITRENARNFSELVMASAFGFSDLLLIPHRLYGASELYSFIAGLEGFERHAF